MSSNFSNLSAKRKLFENYSPLSPPKKQFIRLGSASRRTDLSEDAAPIAINGLSGTIHYDMKTVLEQFVAQIKNQTIFKFKSVWGHDPVSFFFPPEVDWALLFSPNKFLSHFNKAFGRPFSNFISSLTHTRFAGFSIVLNPAELASDTGSLTFEQAHYFRLMFCLIMGTILQIDLPCCACFPKTFLQWTAWQSGIKMNCISQSCSSWLETHSETYDSLFVGDCSQTLVQLALVNIGSMNANTVATNIKLKISSSLNTITSLIEGAQKTRPT